MQTLPSIHLLPLDDHGSGGQAIPSISTARNVPEGLVCLLRQNTHEKTWCKDSQDSQDSQDKIEKLMKKRFIFKVLDESGIL